MTEMTYLNLSQPFVISRDGEKFYLVLRGPREHRMTRTRFRRHGRNKYRYDLSPVAGSGEQALPITADVAKWLRDMALASGRLAEQAVIDTAQNAAEAYAETGRRIWSIFVP